MGDTFSKDVKLLVVFASVIVSFAAVVLIGIAILGKFKDMSGSLWGYRASCGGVNASTPACTWNTTVDYFTVALTFMGSFAILLCLGGLGKVLIRMFKAA